MLYHPGHPCDPKTSAFNLEPHNAELFFNPCFSGKPEEPRKKTLTPIVTGTSILAIKYKDGVMMSGDTLGSYGSLARFRDLSRIRAVGETTILGGSGDYSDYQNIMDLLADLIDKDNAFDDGSNLQPKEIYHYLSRVLYNRRCNFDPFWNELVLCGFSKGESFLGQVDLVGTTFEDHTLATGYGAYIARPLLRKAYRPDLTEDEARAVLEDCMRVLYYRDARTINKVQFAKVTAEGIQIEDAVELTSEWRHCEQALGYESPV